MYITQQLKNQRWALAWTVVILIFCCIRMPDTHGSGFFFEGFDKLVHLGFFFVLTVLMFFGKIAYQHNYNYNILTIIKIVLLTACIGGGIELLQYNFFTYRSAEWWDFGCDMIGVSMGVFSYVLMHKSDYYENKK
jgi:VanZ family protein